MFDFIMLGVGMFTAGFALALITRPERVVYKDRTVPISGVVYANEALATTELNNGATFARLFFVKVHILATQVHLEGIEIMTMSDALKALDLLTQRATLHKWR